MHSHLPGTERSGVHGLTISFLTSGVRRILKMIGQNFPIILRTGYCFQTSSGRISSWNVPQLRSKRQNFKLKCSAIAFKRSNFKLKSSAAAVQAAEFQAKIFSSCTSRGRISSWNVLQQIFKRPNPSWNFQQLHLKWPNFKLKFLQLTFKRPDSSWNLLPLTFKRPRCDKLKLKSKSSFRFSFKRFSRDPRLWRMNLKLKFQWGASDLALAFSAAAFQENPGLRWQTWSWNPSRASGRTSSVFQETPDLGGWTWSWKFSDELQAELQAFSVLDFRETPDFGRQTWSWNFSDRASGLSSGQWKKKPKGHAKEAENDFNQSSVPVSSAAQGASRS